MIVGGDLRVLERQVGVGPELERFAVDRLQHFAVGERLESVVVVAGRRQQVEAEPDRLIGDLDPRRRQVVRFADRLPADDDAGRVGGLLRHSLDVGVEETGLQPAPETVALAGEVHLDRYDLAAQLEVELEVQPRLGSRNVLDLEIGQARQVEVGARLAVVVLERDQAVERALLGHHFEHPLAEKGLDLGGVDTWRRLRRCVLAEERDARQGQRGGDCEGEGGVRNAIHGLVSVRGCGQRRSQK